MLRTLTLTFLLFAILLSPLSAIVPVGGINPVAHAMRRGGDWYEARARLTSESSIKGKAVYRDRQRRRGLEQRLQVEIERARPFTSYVVIFKGRRLGVIRTNLLGRGKLKLRTAQFIHNNRWQPLPRNFPRLRTGDEISVGPAHGRFSVRR